MSQPSPEQFARETIAACQERSADLGRVAEAFLDVSRAEPPTAREISAETGIDPKAVRGHLSEVRLVGVAVATAHPDSGE